ncbi:unnamed protein product [Meganyctiphanes norvegica]|uniref:CHK kinase-like domain-containing protein n=1 Tax=Meganyctiphanes norvegica TaxID=48144 RepID=A0AAV2S0T2_MEGNR
MKMIFSSIIQNSDYGGIIMDKCIHKCVQEALYVDKGRGAKLLKLQVKPFSEKECLFHYNVARIEAEFEFNEKTDKTSYILKLNTLRFHKGVQDKSSDMVVKEANFYMHLLNDLNAILIKKSENSLAFQRCYYVNNEKDKELIILEDFQDRGFKLSDKKGTSDVHHASLILKELGRLHAAAILLQQQHSLVDLRVKYKCLKDIKDKEYIDIFVGNSLPFAANLIEKIGGYERTRNWLDLTRRNVYDFHIRTLTHTEFTCQNEYWSNNVVFRYNHEDVPIEAMFIDVLINRSLSIDAALMFFLSHNQDIPPETLLQAYLNSFRNILQDVNGNLSLDIDALSCQAKSSSDSLHESITVVNLLMQSNVYTSITEYKECVQSIFKV